MTSLAAMTLLGLASGVHCVGMCGGIVGAFSTKRVFFKEKNPEWQRQLLFNLGRISSYTAAGALAGALGGAGTLAADLLPAQTAMLVAANVVLILIGLQLAGRSAWSAGMMRRLEALGAPLWRAIGPLAARLMDARSAPAVFAAGALWGWLPCGLVYGALVVAAATSSSAPEGAAAMLAFGAGTLPNLFAAGVAAARIKQWFARQAVRTGAGVAVLGFGTWGLANAAGVADSIRRGILCL